MRGRGRSGCRWKGFSSWKAEFHSPRRLSATTTKDAARLSWESRNLSVNRSDKNSESGKGEMSKDCRLTSNFRNRN